MYKAYVITRQPYGKYWRYDDREAIGATVRAACRAVKGFWRLKGCAVRRDGEWIVKRYRYIPHPLLDAAESD